MDANVRDVDGAMRLLERQANHLDRYKVLRAIQSDNVQLFFQLLFRHTEELLPYVYTPTVGEACSNYCRLNSSVRGLFIRASDRGSILTRLQAWPEQNIRVVVVTDGERVLGLGDLGVGGMAISEGVVCRAFGFLAEHGLLLLDCSHNLGKILLYTVAAGVPPQLCLPVCLDVGTDNQQLLADPSYYGARHKRLRGREYDEFVDEFIEALRAWQPHVLLQFEDFGSANAFGLLERWRGRSCAFNDDIQGTACIALAGLLSAARASGKGLHQHTILFLGAGEAGTGIGQLLAEHLHLRHGMSLEEGRRRCFYVDSKGLVCASRRGDGLQEHKLPFAHDVPYVKDLTGAIEQLQPTAIVGVSAQPGAFTHAILQRMAQLNERPIIFPLSNPTSKAECTAEDAFRATGGRCVFASGSPFGPVELPGGRKVYPAQANNAYIFPAIGHAALLTRCSHISDGIFLAAAEQLAGMCGEADLAVGRLFPPFSRVRQVSEQLTVALCGHMVREGLGREPEGGLPAGGWKQVVQKHSYAPAPDAKL